MYNNLEHVHSAGVYLALEESLKQTHQTDRRSRTYHTLRHSKKKMGGVRVLKTEKVTDVLTE